jgi:hypothetical protein
MSSIRRRGATLALAVLLVAAAAAFAVAAGKGPKTDAVQASFTAQRTAGKTKTCTGEDGTYANTSERFEGTATGDARLTGKLVVTTRSLVNEDSGLGTSSGDVRILDAATGHMKAHGKFSAVVTDGSVLNGFLAGHVHPQGDSPRRDAQLWANFRAESTQEGAVTGELGGGPSENTAVIQSGGCGKPKPKPAKAHGKPAKPKPKPKTARP